MDIIKKTAQDIKDLKIQGATNITLASLKALKKDWQEEKYQDIKDLEEKIKILKNTRPTEPLLFNCLNNVFSQVEELNSLNHLTQIIDDLVQNLDEIQKEIVQNGVGLIKDKMTIFTHCHSTSVVEILKAAKKKGKEFKVFLTETRPKYQGRITAKELIKAGIKATMTTDSAAAYIISKEDNIPIDLVILGCDAILPDKGVFNKIGSYGIAFSAHEAKIPVFIAGSLLKTSIKPLIIEERGLEEVWKKKPRNLKILNLAFDFIPQRFITSLITEFGLIKSEEIKTIVAEHYSFILRKN
ncbi:S-methyl-5-thioribose-1-phosphate isomerase [Candidatus Microgenomates bacterium]|nr:S-methyl-5-thioribose-1-phosphate isomerase [Candidatus Microgenomates bacterium]